MIVTNTVDYAIRFAIILRIDKVDSHERFKLNSSQLSG